MATSLLMGFASGVPLVVVVTLLQAWFKDGGVDLTTIGLLTLVSLPYSLKFLWAPWLDWIAPFGRRRQSWLLISQAGVVCSLLGLSLTDPTDIARAAVLAVSVCFWSATQDVAVDAYRREDFLYEELTAGTAAYIWGYRLGMVAVAGGGLVLADQLGWAAAFKITAMLVLVGPLTLLFSPEPAVPGGSPKTLQESVVGPLRDFFSKPDPWLVLAFILFYKLGEQLVGSLNTTFFMAAGYSKTQIGLIVKAFGLAGTLAGVSMAGLMVKKRGLVPCLWFFGWLQLANNACLTALWLLPPDDVWLALIISLDHLVVGAGSTVFVAFLASKTNVSYTATQFALLTSLMALPRSLLSSPSGWLVGQLGWPGFFMLGAALTLPGLFLLKLLIKRGSAGPSAEAVPAGEAVPPPIVLVEPELDMSEAGPAAPPPLPAVLAGPDPGQAPPIKPGRA
jgi:PAT family beta-lactamase induction signal transducer AmpG